MLSILMILHMAMPAGIGDINNVLDVWAENNACFQYIEHPSIALSYVMGEMTFQWEQDYPLEYPIFYTHVPALTDHQVPLTIEFQDGSEFVKGYRYLDYGNGRWLVAIYLERMEPSDEYTVKWRHTVVHWTAGYYENLPEGIPLSTLQDLPEETMQYLKSSEVVQSDHPEIIDFANQIKPNADDVVTFSNDILSWLNERCHYSVPGDYLRALDALSMLRHENGTCTSFGNAAVALFRAKGIPAEVNIVAPISSNPYFMHWIIRTFVPGYGWVYSEPQGIWALEPTSFVVMFPCKIQDEMQVIRALVAEGAEGYWAQSMNVKIPDISHSCYWIIKPDSVSPDDLNRFVIDLKEACIAHHRVAGFDQLPYQDYSYKAGWEDIDIALKNVETQWVDEGLSAALDAAIYAANIVPDLPEPFVETVFSEDFEDFSSGNWLFESPEWEVGNPTYEISWPHSGSNVLGTGLDREPMQRESLTVSLPRINLSNCYAAELKIWVYNQMDPYVDGVYLYNHGNNGPMCIYQRLTGGVYRESGMVTGQWNEVIVDLAPELAYDSELNLQIRYLGWANLGYAGCYIDDIKVIKYRNYDPMSIPESNFALYASPNPFSTILRINSISDFQNDNITVYDLQGRQITTLQLNKQQCIWDAADQADGIYYLRSGKMPVLKLVKLSK